MRSSRVLTLVAGVVWLAACGGDSNGPSNAAPTADFRVDCTDLTCTFTDASSDTDGNVQSVAWDFGDPNSGANTATAAPTSSTDHTFSAGGTFSVKLTATDNGGATNTKTGQVVVTAPAPGGPAASFDVSCAGNSCTVTNTSQASPAATWAWNFGDGSQTSTDQNPAPVQYNVTQPTTFTITLVVTDNGLTSQATKQVSVQPGASLTCNGSACTLGLDEKATVVVTLASSNCQIHGNTFVITQPAVDTLFTDGCYTPVGTSFQLNNGAAYDQGTQLAAEVLTGVAGTTNAQLRVEGDFANGWTLRFDDGFVGPNEPDFNDLVMTVKATVAP
jgi:PKD repeat protein